MSLGEGLLEALDLCCVDAPRLVQLIGAGGKTTTMYAIAQALALRGSRVVSTTTTLIGPPRVAQSPALLLADDCEDLCTDLDVMLREHRQVTIAQRRLGAWKLAGMPPAQLDALIARDSALIVVAECDGAAGRALKAHAHHEPVLSHAPSLVVAVVGLSVIGKPLNADHVHRAALLARRLELSLGAPVDIDTVVGAVAGPGGYLTQLPPAATAALLLTQHTPERAPAAQRLAQALRAHPGAAALTHIVAASETQARCLHTPA